MPEPFLYTLPFREIIERHLGRRQRIDKFLEQAGGALHVADWNDDFWGDTVNGTYRTMGTGTPTRAIDTDAKNGEMRLGTSAVSDDSSGVSIGLHCAGDQYSVAVARIKLPTITSVKVEFGFTDAHGDEGAVNNVATPTFTADDAVVWVIDTNTDGNWHGRAVQATTAATAYDPAFAPVADTYEYFVVVLEDTRAKFLRANVDGKITHESAWTTAAVTAATALTPWLYVRTRAGAARTLDVDRLKVYQARTTAA